MQSSSGSVAGSNLKGMDAIGSPTGIGSFTLLPKFTRFYFHYSRKAFNMAQYLTKELQFDDSVFHSALCYWHSFIDIHGLKVVNEVLLIAACVFLAAKVAHYKFQARRLVILAFDIRGGKNSSAPNGGPLPATSHSPPQQSEEEEEEEQEKARQRRLEESIASWQAALLDVELLLCDTLQFNFHIPNPCGEMEDLLIRCAHQHGLTDDPRRGSGGPQSALLEEARSFVASLIARVKRVHIFLLISPLSSSSQLSTEDCSSALVYIVVQYSLLSRKRQPPPQAMTPNQNTQTTSSSSSSGRGDATDMLQKALESFGKRVIDQLRLPDPQVLDGVLGVIVETFHFMRKTTDISALDELVEAHGRSSPTNSNNLSVGSPTWR